jgi:hypothetical protein
MTSNQHSQIGEAAIYQNDQNYPFTKMNPAEIEVQWQTSCARQNDMGKHIMCFQAEDYNIDQPLDSRVRCLIVNIQIIVNDPPFFCRDTPAADTVLPICVGRDINFRVTVCDPQHDDVATIEFTSDLTGLKNGDGLSPVGEQVWPYAGEANEDPRSNEVYRDFNLVPDQSITDRSICFLGKDNNDFDPRETGLRCLDMSIRYPPVFIPPTPMSGGDGEGEAEPIPVLNLCEEYTFTVTASDKNTEDDVSIFVLEDPGLPMGAVVSANACEQAPDVGEDEVASNCNPVSRTFTWTPHKGQEGRTYKVCFIARDNQSYCQEGGFYSEDVVCHEMHVHAPEPSWDLHTPADGSNYFAYVGKDFNLDFAVHDETYCTAVHNTDGLPHGAELSECEGGDTCNTCSRHFKWRPVVGRKLLITVQHFRVPRMGV